VPQLALRTISGMPHSTGAACTPSALRSVAPGIRSRPWDGFGIRPRPDRLDTRWE
jgi:hypothetical protein